MAKPDLFAIASPGSRALKNTKYERYCRLRALAQPRIAAYREAGWETSDDENAYSNACRLDALGLGSALSISRIKTKS
jgi:hypothetical protein